MLLRAGGRRAVAIVAVAAGLVGGGVGLYDALTAKDRVLDDAAEELAGQFGATAEAVRTILGEAIEAGELGISISIGLYMVIAGGALGVVGGILGMRRAPQQVAAPVTASASPAVAIPDTPAAQDPSSVAMAPDPSGMPAPPPVEDEAGQPPGP